MLNISISQIPQEMRELPSFYWLPKNPIDSRFITASCHCTAKPLSRLLTACLTTITQHYKEYCDGINRNTGVNCFRIINNSQQVLRKLHKIDESSSARHFDFSTLYTNIPHFQLKQNFEHLVNEAFKIRGASFLSVNRLNQAFWSNHPVPNFFNFGGKDIINFLIDNLYNYYGG